MKSYPNSRMITVNREIVKKNSSRFYICIYDDNLSEAMRALTGAEFKIYIALLFNRDGYSLTYSSDYISEQTGLNCETCRKLFNSLCDKGFIVPINKAKTKFNFYETRKLAKESEKRYIADPSTGELFLMSYNDLVRLTGFKANEYWERGIKEYEE